MGFLSIAFLAALPLAAAPILLHFFDRRRNVVIEWGAMQFLMEAATRQTSARKLKQWILLLMRVLAIAALVFALARPTLPGSWFGSTDRGETIFVVDNSMSMMRTGAEASLFDEAVDRAIEKLADVKSGDSVRVLLASPYPTWATAGSIRLDPNTRVTISDQFREIKPTNGSSDLLASLFTAVQADAEPTIQRRQIVLLTDGQSSDWKTSNESGWQRFRETLQAAAIPTQLDVIQLDIGAQKPRNIAINEMRSSRTVVGVNQPFTITAEIQNHSDIGSAACAVTWTTEGREFDNDTPLPSLDGGETQDVVWKHSFSETGVRAISCRIGADDDLAADNHATVVVEVVAQVPVLLVEGSPGRAEMEDTFFVQAALGWVDGEPMAEKGVFEPVVVTPVRLERIKLSDYRAIVVPDLRDLGKEAIERLRTFANVCFRRRRLVGGRGAKDRS